MAEPELLERTVLEDLDTLIPMVLEMDSFSEQISELNEEMVGLTERLNILKSKRAKLSASRDVINYGFWRDARLQDKEWFRKTRERGFCIHVEKLKDPDSNKTTGLKLIAHNPQNDVMTHIRDIFRPGIRDEEDRDGD